MEPQPPQITQLAAGRQVGAGVWPHGCGRQAYLVYTPYKTKNCSASEFGDTSLVSQMNPFTECVTHNGNEL